MVDISSCEGLLKCYRNELVPENPNIPDNGVRGLLLYRLKCGKGRHPDSCLTNENTKWISLKLYGAISESQDTIFNAWSLIKIYDAIHYGIGKTRDDRSVFNSIDKGEDVFLPEHKEEFDKLADRQHCIANFMPAPKGFNGFGSYHGKGEYDCDNDFPDVYYKRAKKEFPQMYKWINDNMDNYCLQLFQSEITGWENHKAYYQKLKDNISEKDIYEIAVRMNKLLEERASGLLKKSNLAF